MAAEPAVPRHVSRPGLQLHVAAAVVVAIASLGYQSTAEPEVVAVARLQTALEPTALPAAKGVAE